MTADTIAARFGPPPAPALLAPQSALYARLQLASGSAAEQAEALRVGAACAAMFEEACGRPLLRRQHVELDAAVDCEDGLQYAARRGAWLLDLDAALPVESVEAVLVDDDAASEFDVDFDAATTLSAGDYRVADVDGPVLLIRDSVALPPAEAGAAVRVRLTCGYEARSDEVGWAPTPGARPMPMDLEEAFLEQCSLVWRRRLTPHLRYEGKPTGAGSASAGFADAKLSPKAREVLARYATWACALNLAGGASAGGGAGGGAP